LIIKLCNTCKQEKHISFFAFKSKKDGTYRGSCKECENKKSHDRYMNNKLIIDNIKSEKSCEKCGENRIYTLDFHHIDPSLKDQKVSSALSSASPKKALEEIEKCIILCSNCHREFHYFNKENNITLEEFLSL